MFSLKRSATVGWVVALLTGCPAVEGEPIDTDVEPVLPCGDAAPEDCTERVEGTCFMPSIADDQIWLLDERNIRSLISGDHCGYTTILVCPDAPRVVVTNVAGLYATPSDTGGWEIGEGPVQFYVFDSESLALVAEARRGNRLESCDLLWWGERGTYDTCFPISFDRLYLHFGDCAGDEYGGGGTCDTCACNVNEFTDFQNEACAQ